MKEIFQVFTPADAVALAFFILAWTVYHHWIGRGQREHTSLSSQMNAQRMLWMEQMSHREVRIVDTAVMASLQNGTAFFASTSLIMLGGAAALLRSTDDVLKVFADLPFGLVTARGLWELKIIGLAMIFGYAFFKFSWAYRLFNYTAILMGSTPAFNHPDKDARDKAARRAAHMNIVAGRHFTRGQRALHFSFAYLGWFVSPYLLVVTTAAIVYVMVQRQFKSAALRAVMLDGDITN